MEAILNRCEGSGNLDLPKTIIADLQVNKGQLCIRRCRQANTDLVIPWNLLFSKSSVVQ